VFTVADAALKGRSSTAALAHGSQASCKNAARMDSTCRKKNDKDEPDIVVVVRGASENHRAEARSCFIVADAALKGRSSTAASD